MLLFCHNRKEVASAVDHLKALTSQKPETAVIAAPMIYFNKLKYSLPALAKVIKETLTGPCKLSAPPFLKPVYSLEISLVSPRL